MYFLSKIQNLFKARDYVLKGRNQGTLNVQGITQYHWVPDFPVLNRLSKITTTKFMFRKTTKEDIPQHFDWGAISAWDQKCCIMYSSSNKKLKMHQKLFSVYQLYTAKFLVTLEVISGLLMMLCVRPIRDWEPDVIETFRFCSVVSKVYFNLSWHGF